MISVVLKRGTDYEAFKALLSASGYTFKSCGSGRILFVDGEFEQFSFKDHQDIDSCYQTIEQLDIRPALSFDNETNIVSHYVGDSTTTPLRTWAKHRICRRTNPFRRESELISTNHTVRYGYTRTGVGVDIYILDSGLNLDHIEFGGNVERLTGETTGADSATAVTMAGGTNVYAIVDFHATNTVSNAIGLNIGIATGAKCYYNYVYPSVTGENDFVAAYDEVYTHYINRAVSNRPAVLSHSVAGSGIGNSPAFTAILDDLINAGVVILFPAGNTRNDLENTYLGMGEAHPDAIRVGAVGVHGTPMYNTRSGTGFGDNVEIYAPGQNVVCAWPENNNHYVSINGTSFATPYTTGVIACMLQGYGRLTNREQVLAVKAKLIENSTKDVLHFPDGTYYRSGAILHNRFLYLDPFVSIEPINGLTPL